jgi:hypothetical protein
MLVKLRMVMAGAVLLACARDAVAQQSGQAKAQAALAAEQQSPLAATTISAFLAACPSDKASCSSMVGSVMITGQLNDMICMPDTPGDYTLPVIAWLTAHPETTAMTVNDGITLALKTVYRC